jgi:multidrug efflux pump subunit AcrA (membrane-fusion protein)
MAIHRHSARTVLSRAFALLVLASLPLSGAEAAIRKKPVVFIQKANLAELYEVLTYPARIEPKIKASVIAEADGIVAQIRAPLGTQVKAQAPLLSIRNTDPVYQYAPMLVRSPVSGVVSRVDVTEGSRVSRGDKLLLVTDPSQSRVVVEVTAAELNLIKPGLLAELTIPGQVSSLPLPVRVKGLSPFVDPATGTASCELELVNSKTGANRLPAPGVIARVTFQANKRRGFSIPDSALTFRGKDPFIRIVKDKKATLVRVVLGRRQGGSVEIVKGLTPGDQIVERANGFVAEGEEVEIQAAASGDHQG